MTAATALVRLVLDYTESGSGQPITLAPRYLRTRDMNRWHRPRSACRYPQGHLGVRLWCGQTLSLDTALHRGSADDLDAPVCGSCEGRALGYGQDRRPDGLPDLIFTPTKCQPPRKCPGSRTTSLVQEIPDPRGWPRVGRCLVCGVIAPMRAGGGPYNGTYGISAHSVGDHLIPGCPAHGWYRLVRVGDHVSCECHTDGGVA